MELQCIWSLEYRCSWEMRYKIIKSKKSDTNPYINFIYNPVALIWTMVIMSLYARYFHLWILWTQFDVLIPYNKAFPVDVFFSKVNFWTFFSLTHRLRLPLNAYFTCFVHCHCKSTLNYIQFSMLDHNFIQRACSWRLSLSRQLQDQAPFDPIPAGDREAGFLNADVSLFYLLQSIGSKAGSWAHILIAQRMATCYLPVTNVWGPAEWMWIQWSGAISSCYFKDRWRHGQDAIYIY